MRVAFFVWIFLILLLLAGIFLIGLPKEAPEESITEVMRDGVLHEGNRMNLFGLTVNPGLISAFVVTGILLLVALLLRIFFIPRMKEIPGRFQCLLEGAVGLFSGQARGAAPRRSGFLGAYLFRSAVIFFSAPCLNCSVFRPLPLRGVRCHCPLRSRISTARWPSAVCLSW